MTGMEADGDSNLAGGKAVYPSRVAATFGIHTLDRFVCSFFFRRHSALEPRPGLFVFDFDFLDCDYPSNERFAVPSYRPLPLHNHQQPLTRLRGSRTKGTLP